MKRKRTGGKEVCLIQGKGAAPKASATGSRKKEDPQGFAKRNRRSGRRSLVVLGGGGAAEFGLASTQDIR